MMRQIVVLMQAPGGPEEDTSGGFKYGGWTVPYADELSGKIMGEQINGNFDLLLGRNTFDIFAAYWPHQDAEASSIAAQFNEARKYVVSHEPTDLSWENSILIGGDVVAELRTLKRQDGPVLQVHGSGNLIQTLLKNDLVDELWLKIFPVLLGTGKRLFAEGTIPAAFELTTSVTSPRGVIFANYRRSGEVTTGSF
jgi:dihydrofolate reductase